MSFTSLLLLVHTHLSQPLYNKMHRSTSGDSFSTTESTATLYDTDPPTTLFDTEVAGRESRARRASQNGKRRESSYSATPLLHNRDGRRRYALDLLDGGPLLTNDELALQDRALAVQADALRLVWMFDGV